MKTQVDGKHQLEQCQLVRQQGHRGGRDPGAELWPWPRLQHFSRARQQTRTGTMAAAAHTPAMSH